MEGKRWKAEQEWTMSKLYTTGMKYRAGEFLWCDGGHPWCFFVSSSNTKFLLTMSGLALFRWCEVLYNCKQASCCYSLQQLLSLVDQLQSTLAEEMSLEDSWSSAEEVSSPAMRTRLGLFHLVSLVGPQFSVHFASSQLAVSWAATWPVRSLQWTASNLAHEGWKCCSGMGHMKSQEAGEKKGITMGMLEETCKDSIWIHSSCLNASGWNPGSGLPSPYQLQPFGLNHAHTYFLCGCSLGPLHGSKNSSEHAHAWVSLDTEKENLATSFSSQ